MTFLTLPQQISGRFIQAADTNGNVQLMSLATFQAMYPNAVVYIPTADFQTQYNGAMLNFQQNQPFVTTPDLLTFLQANNAPISYAWGNPINFSTAAGSQNAPLLFNY